MSYAWLTNSGSSSNAPVARSRSLPYLRVRVQLIRHLKKHARLIFTYRMSARMSDYLYTHPYQPCSCALCGLPKVSAGFPLLTKLQNSDSRKVSLLWPSAFQQQKDGSDVWAVHSHYSSSTNKLCIWFMDTWI